MELWKKYYRKDKKYMKIILLIMDIMFFQEDKCNIFYTDDKILFLLKKWLGMRFYL